MVAFLKYFNYSALEVSGSDKVFSQLIDQIPEEITVKSVMFQVESNRQFTIDEFKIVSDTIDNMGAEDEHIFYSAKVVDKPEHCWMGMIYMIG